MEEELPDGEDSKGKDDERGTVLESRGRAHAKDCMRVEGVTLDLGRSLAALASGLDLFPVPVRAMQRFSAGM